MNSNFSSRVAAGKGFLPRSSRVARLSPAGAVDYTLGPDACIAAGGTYGPDMTGNAEFACEMPGPVPSRVPSRAESCLAAGGRYVPDPTGNAEFVCEMPGPVPSRSDRRMPAPGTGDQSMPSFNPGYTPTGIPAPMSAPTNAYCVPEWVFRNPWPSAAPSSDWRQGPWPGGTYQTVYSSASPAVMPSLQSQRAYLESLPGYRGAGALFVSDDGFFNPAVNTLAVLVGAFVGVKVGQKIFK